MDIVILLVGAVSRESMPSDICIRKKITIGFRVHISISCLGLKILHQLHPLHWLSSKNKDHDQHVLVESHFMIGMIK